MFPGKSPGGRLDAHILGWTSNPFPQLKIQEVHRWTRIQVLQFCWNEKILSLSENSGENDQFQWLKWIQTPLSSYFSIPALGSKIPAEVARSLKHLGAWHDGKSSKNPPKKSNVAMWQWKPQIYIHLYDFPVKILIFIRDFQLPCLIKPGW